MAQMTARERVLAALNHQQPDRLPIEFGGRNTGIHAFAHRELKRYLSMNGGEEMVRSYHTYIVEPDARLIEMFGRDITPIYPKSGSDWRLDIDPVTNTWSDEWRTKYYMPEGGYYYDILEVPLAQAESVEDLNNYRWPDPRDSARTAGAKEAVKMAQKAGKAAMLCSGRAGIWTTALYLRGVEQFYIDLAANLDLAEELAERITQWHIDYWDALLDQVGDAADIVHVEGDLGGMHGPLFSPVLFRRIYKPRFARWISFIKSRTNAKVFLHSCGSVYWAITDLIECGVDALNPVQVNAKDMDTAKLKREFGEDITFWGGGCDTGVLQHGTISDVRDEVLRRIDDLAQGGGYIFGSVHNIQPNVPPENIVTMFETARKYGGY